MFLRAKPEMLLMFMNMIHFPFQVYSESGKTSSIAELALRYSAGIWPLQNNLGCVCDQSWIVLSSIPRQAPQASTPSPCLPCFPSTLWEGAPKKLHSSSWRSWIPGRWKVWESFWDVFSISFLFQQESLPALSNWALLGFCKSMKAFNLLLLEKVGFEQDGDRKEQGGSWRNNWLIKNTSTNNWMSYFDKFQLCKSPNIKCKCLFLLLFDSGC